MTEKTTSAFDWRTALEQTIHDFSDQFVGYLPQLLGAITLLIVGWLVAHLLRLGTRKIVRGFDALYARFARSDTTKPSGVSQSYELIASQVIFWAILIFFLAASANLLGWNLLTDWMRSIVSFLPSLITGLLVIMAGFLIGSGVHSAIMRTASTAGVAQSAMLARIAQIVVLFCSIVIGVEQIGLNVEFLTNVIVVIVGILLAGAALAFGFGARTMVANIIGAQHMRKHCRVGEQLNVGEYKGEILEVTQTAIVLDAKQGRTVIPAKLCHEQILLLNPEKDARSTKKEQKNG